MKEIDENTDNVVKLTKALYALFKLTQAQFVKVSIGDLFEKHEAPYRAVIAPYIEKEGYIESKKAGTAREYKWINGEPTSADAIKLIEICRKAFTVSSQQSQKKAKAVKGKTETPAAKANAPKAPKAPKEPKKTPGIREVSDAALFSELKRRGYSGKLKYEAEVEVA